MSKDEKLVLLVLNTGENLMGTLIGEDVNDIQVKDIVAFAPKPDGTGVMTIPYLQFSVENDAKFKICDIRHQLTPNKDLSEYYNKQFSKIIVPEGKLVKPIMTGV